MALTCPPGCLPNVDGSRPQSSPALSRFVAELGALDAVFVRPLVVDASSGPNSGPPSEQLPVEPASGLVLDAGGPEVRSVWTAWPAAAILVRVPGGLPPREQRALGDHRAGSDRPCPARCRSARRLVAEPVGVRIAGQHVARDVGWRGPRSVGRHRNASASDRRPSGRRRGCRRGGRSAARRGRRSESRGPSDRPDLDLLAALRHALASRRRV